MEDKRCFGIRAVLQLEPLGTLISLSLCEKGNGRRLINVCSLRLVCRLFWISQSITRIDISSTFEELTFPK